MNILAIPVQSISDLITNSSSEVFILDTGKTCEEVNTILKGFTSGFDYREWRKKLRSGEIEEGWSYPGTIFEIANGWLKDPEDEQDVLELRMDFLFEPFEIHDYGNGIVGRGFSSSYKEPIHAAMVINVQDKTIHKRQAYKCSVCHKWHVGRGKTTLTDEDKRKLKIKHNIR